MRRNVRLWVKFSLIYNDVHIDTNMPKLDSSLLFRNTSPHSREDVTKRFALLKVKFEENPTWMIGTDRQYLVGCYYRRGANVPGEFVRGDFGKPLSDFSSERQKSSTVQLLPLFVLPTENSGIRPFQLFVKTKTRLDFKQIWEFLMLDLWSETLRYYSKMSQITLTAPQSYTLDGQTLLMSHELGTIGKHLANDYRPKHPVTLPFGATTLYDAFALHLGALARVKEEEELSHGDYQLRHVLFDPGKTLDSIFYVQSMWNQINGQFTEVTQFLTVPHLSVVDIEHGLRTPRPQIQEENNQMLVQARKYAQSYGISADAFERAYREGYDKVAPLGVTQKLVDAQYERWGVSVDNLF